VIDSSDYARHWSLSASLKRALVSPVKLPSFKLSKISTEPADIFVENLSRSKSDRADLGIPSLCLI
jgi:hypothetical protein